MIMNEIKFYNVLKLCSNDYIKYIHNTKSTCLIAFLSNFTHKILSLIRRSYLVCSHLLVTKYLQANQ